MILVDTCVWIDLLQGRRTAAVRILEQIEERAEVEICVSGIIIFEVLRGISDPRRRRFVSDVFATLERRDYRHGSMHEMLEHESACRRGGLSLPRLGDWLIIQTALDHDLEILSSDEDFVKISSCVPIRLARV